MPDQQTETRLEAIESELKNLRRKLNAELAEIKSGIDDLKRKIDALDRRH